MDEVRRLGSLQGAEINQAKEVLAYEITKIVHGEEEAIKAREASKALFGAGAKAEDIPTTSYPASRFAEGIDIITMMCDAKLASSRSDARRTIQQGGVTVNNKKVENFDLVLTDKDFEDGAILIRKGKKSYHRFIAE